MFIFQLSRRYQSYSNTGLDDETLKICVQLIEAGINPEALATVVLELRRETAAIMVSTD